MPPTLTAECEFVLTAYILVESRVNSIAYRIYESLKPSAAITRHLAKPDGGSQQLTSPNRGNPLEYLFKIRDIMLFMSRWHVGGANSKC